MFIIYITTCLVNQKIYVGIHEQDEPYTFDGYLGSGDWLDKAVKKYGKENFIRETLFYFWNNIEALNKEKEIVSESFVKHDWNYNIVVGGGMPPKLFGDDNPTRRPEVRDKISRHASSRRPEVAAKISDTLKSKGINHPSKRLEVREKFRLSHLGKPWSEKRRAAQDRKYV